MTTKSQLRGKRFEEAVGALLRRVEDRFQGRVKLVPQVQTVLFDGRSKVIDFSFEYKTVSSLNQVAIECQDRDKWETEILDKILTIRKYSCRNRFWFVYAKSGFLTEDAVALLDSHGVMHFSFEQLDRHLIALTEELEATRDVESRYSPPPDQAMVAE